MRAREPTMPTIVSRPVLLSATSLFTSSPLRYERERKHSHTPLLLLLFLLLHTLTSRSAPGFPCAALGNDGAGRRASSQAAHADGGGRRVPPLRWRERSPVMKLDQAFRPVAFNASWFCRFGDSTLVRFPTTQGNKRDSWAGRGQQTVTPCTPTKLLVTPWPGQAFGGARPWQQSA